MQSETAARDDMVLLARSLFERGLTAGSTGNLSVRVDGGFIMTPTNASFGFLDAEQLSRLDDDGRWVSGDKPTKEAFLHLAMYRAQPSRQSVSHLHSTHAVCLSCLQGINPDNMITPYTPYLTMRVGQVALAPYYRPGDEALGPVVEKLAAKYNGIVIANHGPVVAAKSLRDAVFAIEELEESARIQLLLGDRPANTLTEAQLTDLSTMKIG